MIAMISSLLTTAVNSGKNPETDGSGVGFFKIRMALSAECGRSCGVCFS
jgi:hypothetical protein